MFTRTASARYDGLGKDGKGRVSTQSGVLADQPYGFGTRFGDEPGTNPEELIAAAHAACFTMALSFGLARAGHADGTLETTARVKLEKEGKLKRVPFSDRAQMKKLVDPVMAEYAKEIGAQQILAKINSIK